MKGDYTMAKKTYVVFKKDVALVASRATMKPRKFNGIAKARNFVANLIRVSTKQMLTKADFRIEEFVDAPVRKPLVIWYPNQNV